MAPTQPPRPSRPAPTTLTDPYLTPHKTNKALNQHLKRSSKHSALLSRISKTAPGSKITKRRRRPSKKLAANLGDLADALPDDPTADDEVKERRERSEGKIQHKSLKSRPGARKKKEKVVAMEMERFRANMAMMAGGSGTGASIGKRGGDAVEEMVGQVEGESRERWKAIRGFISQTMERRDDGGKAEGEG